MFRGCANRFNFKWTMWLIFLLSGLSRPEGISYDWTAKNIYWTDSGKKVIGVARHDGSYQKDVISSDLTKPRAIIVHPLIG